MAEGVLFDIAGEIIRKLGSRALDEIGLWWCVKDELRKLEATVSSIHNVLLDAEEQQIYNRQVKGWLGRLQEVFYDADDLLDDIATEALRRQVMTGNRLTKEVSLFFSSSNRLVYGFKMGHKIKALRERLADIEADKQFPLEVRTWERGYTTMGDKVVIGREGDKNAIIEVLLASNSKENVSVLSIVGIGGLGKSTLAQLIFNDERIKNYFELRIWVCVSDIFDVKMIVRKILESATGTKSEDLELEALKSQLGNIMYSKRYLLVLDDVWNENSERWDNLKKLLEGGSSGSKILVTTRSERVARICSTLKPYVMGCLSPDESLSLFLHAALTGQKLKDSKTNKIAEGIVKKCFGVPLAIKTIASVLYFKDPEREWLPFLENDLSKIAQNENDILSILKLSYDHLSSHLKHCFAYCALFPKAYVIDVKKLIHLWVAQGFIESSSSSLCIEDIGLQYFKELWWRSFFQEVEWDEIGNVKSCKMHDLMHDLATSVAGKSICIIYSEVDKSVRHVSFDFHSYSSHQIPVELSIARKLRTFLLPRPKDFDEVKAHELSIAEVIVSNFRELRVCDMSGAKIENVSNSINRLKHLRYLDVSNNFGIRTLPDSILELQNLQVLKVSSCYRLKELPKDIKKLINLRHLYCDDCWSLTHMPRGLGQLTSLRTLTWFVVAEDNSAAKNVGGLNELNSLNNLRESLEIRKLGYVKNGIINHNIKEKSLLQSLSLCSDRYYDDANVDNEEMAFQNLQPHPNLKRLVMEGYRGTRFPSWVSSLTNLVNIKLKKCRCQHLPPLDQIPSLQNLEIWELNDLEYIEIEGQASTFFPSLKYLQLLFCSKLKGWRKKRDDDDRDDSTTISISELLQFPCLSQFTCVDCPNLSWIPQFPSIGELLQLRGVSEQLVKQIFTISTSSSIVPPLSKLKQLIIWGIEDLEFLPPDGLQNLTSLQRLLIVGCPRLTSMPQEMRSLPSLQELKIDDCPLLSKRCANKKGEDWPFISHIPNIQVDHKRVQWKGRYLPEDEAFVSWLFFS
ncbi:putative disease resistance protein RGA4 [Hevea brasiliensis]|uniref:putative disease resistance protein RGA4 n=1 Tax=Hevea brasiliensis TaxID=3981 RepID=UPI0025E088A2|nr:putative disease resistance protein RGA4 [Hevea brasiliensis]